MNIFFLGTPARLVGYLKSNNLTEEEIFSPTDGVCWGLSYHWMIGHTHPALDDFLREVKFGKPLRIWTISIITADTEARLVETLDNNFRAGLDFVLHSEQNLALPATIIARVRFINLLSNRKRSRRPWGLDQWPLRLEQLSRSEE